MEVEKLIRVPVTIRLSMELKQELERLAREEGRSTNELINLILNRYVKEQKKKK